MPANRPLSLTDTLRNTAEACAYWYAMRGAGYLCMFPKQYSLMHLYSFTVVPLIWAAHNSTEPGHHSLQGSLIIDMVAGVWL